MSAKSASDSGPAFPHAAPGSGSESAKTDDVSLSQPSGSGPLQRDLPQRRSVRLPGYDYGQAGWYFVTIMARQGTRLFAEVTPEATLRYSPLGEQVCQELSTFAARYPLVHLDAWVLMPNHLHAIIGLLPASDSRLARPLGQLVAAFKATTTSRTRPWRSLPGSLWQRNYHEHIIRNAHELSVYREYVRNNPRRWLEKKSGTLPPESGYPLLR